jgi:hypothetical protein
MTIFKNFITEDNVNLSIFLLIHALILLSALTTIFYFFIKPLTKNVWNKVMGLYDVQISINMENIKKDLNMLGANATSLEDQNIINNNNEIVNKSIYLTVVISSILFIITCIIYLFSDINLKDTLKHSISGLVVVAIIYSLFTIFFIQYYKTLDPFIAVQHLLVTTYNNLNPSNKMENTYIQK